MPLSTVTLLAVIPLPSCKLAPTRLAPVSVTGTVVPTTPELGEMELSVGAGGVMLNAILLLVPVGVFTEMLCAPTGALEATTRLAVSCVELITVTLLAVRPVPRFKLPPVRFVPVSVTGTVAPSNPEFGEMDAKVGTLAPVENTTSTQ